MQNKVSLKSYVNANRLYRGVHKWLDTLFYQGVVTLIEPVEPFATKNKMKSRDQHVNLC